jgi:hypothetical protein
VRIIDEDGTDLWRGRTGADGLAIATGLARSTPRRSAPRVLVERDGDAAYVADTSGWYLYEASSDLVGVVFSDRGVYRPGETARVKALLQIATPRGLEALPAGTSITLEVERPGVDKEPTRRRLGPAGGVEWTLAIPADAKVDEPTSLSVRRTEHANEWPSVEGSLLVKAVKPVEFQTTLEVSEVAAVDRPVLAAGGSPRPVRRRPVGATVAWTVTRQRIYQLPQVLQDDDHFVYQTADEDVEAEFDDDKSLRLEDSRRARRPRHARGTIRAAGGAGRTRALHRRRPGHRHVVAGARPAEGGDRRTRCYLGLGTGDPAGVSAGARGRRGRPDRHRLLRTGDPRARPAVARADARMTMREPSWARRDHGARAGPGRAAWTGFRAVAVLVTARARRSQPGR